MWEQLTGFFGDKVVMKTDTIAAIATALSDSGIGIIRISGDEAIEIADQIYRNKDGNRKLKSYESHTIHYGFVIEKETENVLDEVMVSIMKAPRSYTRENTVEISCHGGIYVTRKILERVLQAGARIADPGEFTKRAFLNGRIDLSKAEAVMDLIHAKNEFALQSSLRQLKGSLSDTIKEMRENILYEIAFIESALDDPEHISLEEYPQRLENKTDSIIEKLEKLLKTAEDGKILKEGIQTAIVGKPNAGKSSLLNMLSGEERAIVTDIAGTTRDVLEQTVHLENITLNMIDTAGIRDTEDPIEKIGVERAVKAVEQADLILYVTDISVPLDESDEEIIKLLKNRHVLLLLNKSDLDEVVTKKSILEKFENNDIRVEEKNIITISAKENIGMDTLADSIQDMFFHGKIQYNDEVFITNVRHKEALRDALQSMLQVKKSIENRMPEDFYSIDLMSAYSSLGHIIGEEVEDDLVNEIFSKFCMGK